MLQGAKLLDLAVSDIERVEDLVFTDLCCSGFNHQNRFFGAGDN
ncbi:unannotated protein [freshwater metagenome]|uniref:Unannotated protein n=1 Tax=freshwater metagenome TaxID=449393 RepID=A0A6J5ZS67_9ZZZZ